MTDSRFEELLAEAIQEYGGDYIEVPEEMWKPHRFSRAFKKRMRKILQKERETYLPRKRIPLRLLIAVIVTAIIAVSAAAATVGALREAILGFITNGQDMFANIRADVDMDAPETLETLYEMTWVPEGYEVVEEVSLDTWHYIYYENGEDYIRFGQWTLGGYNTNYDNEGLEIVDARIGSYDGLWMKGNGDAAFVWKMDDYIFEIIAVDDRHIDEETVRKMVESVKKVDS